MRSDIAPAPEQFSSVVSAVGRRSQKKRGVTSWVYDYFVSDPATARVRCMAEGCKSEYAKLTSTSTLAVHLERIHSVSKEASGAVSGDPAQTIFSADGTRLVAHNVLDDEKRAQIFDAIVSWIVDDKQAF
jgi:hypothetical protein